MKVAVYVRQPTPPHEAVAKAVTIGAVASGETAWVFGKDAPRCQEDADVVVVFGIGGDARQVWDANAHARRVLLDKPYTRGSTPGPARYYLCRVAIDAFQPLAYFQQWAHTPHRWNALGLKPMPYKDNANRSFTLFDGASNKYCLWNDLPPWAEWGQEMVYKIGAFSSNPILYRPRLSHNSPPTIRDAILSELPLVEDFARSRVVVSHGGNIGFDAALAGIPHFAIGDSVARPISETDWSKIGEPFVPSEEKRQQWFNDLAYCQWNLDEFADGSAWRYVRETMDLITHLKRKTKIAERTD